MRSAARDRPRTQASGPAPRDGGGRAEGGGWSPAGAAIYATQERIVNHYADEAPGREVVDRARASLTDGRVARATEAGRRLTIRQALDLAMTADKAPA